MPARGQTNIGEMCHSTDDKLIDTVPFSDATDVENPITVSDDDNVSPPPDDNSTYNLEDDITLPSITPHEGSKSGSDGTGDSVDEIQTDSSGEIIPKYFFELPSPSRALNIEFNRCLLLDLNPLPSTSVRKDYKKKKSMEKEDIDTFPAAGISKTERSSSSDSLSPPIRPIKKLRKKICRTSEQRVTDEFESLSTDCEVKSDRSSDETNCSVSLDSTETDKIIPSFLFCLVEDRIFNPELELCLDFDDDSKATDNDIMAEQSFSAKTDCYVEEDHLLKESDSTEQLKWIESELDENNKPFNDLHKETLSTPKHSSSVCSLSLDSNVFYEDDETFIPRYLFAEVA